MAGLTPATITERDTLIEFLRQQRYVLKLAAYGLDDEQAQASPSASALSVGGIIKHVALTEQHWMRRIVRGEHVRRPGRRVRERLPLRRRRDARVGPRVLRRRRSRDRARHRRGRDLGRARADPQGRAVVPAGRGQLVAALGARPHHRGDGAPRGSRRHRARVDRRRDRLRSARRSTRPRRATRRRGRDVPVRPESRRDSPCLPAPDANRWAPAWVSPERMTSIPPAYSRSMASSRSRPHCSKTERRSARRQFGGSSASSFASATGGGAALRRRARRGWPGRCATPRRRRRRVP